MLSEEAWQEIIDEVNEEWERKYWGEMLFDILEAFRREYPGAVKRGEHYEWCKNLRILTDQGVRLQFSLE